MTETQQLLEGMKPGLDLFAGIWAPLVLAGVVLPGFVAFLTYDFLVPSQRKGLGESVLELVAFGALNVALFFWVLWLAHSSGGGFLCWYLSGLAFVFCGPIAIGIASYWARASAIVQKVLPHPTPRPWDYAFRDRSPRLVLCTLRSGRMIGGVFGPGSFISTFPEAEEIYLQHLFVVDDEGKIGAPVDRSRGGLVRRDDCEMVEFFSLQPKPKGGVEHGEG